MEHVIHRSARIGCSPDEAYQHFIDKELLEAFFTVKADVEPTVGGKYELDWDPETPLEQSTVGCKITALAAGHLLAFDWKGPPPHTAVMNEADPLTHVLVAFFPVGQTTPTATEVHVVHSGWGSGDRWAAARDYFDRAWGIVLAALVEEIGAPDSSQAKTVSRA